MFRKQRNTPSTPPSLVIQPDLGMTFDSATAAAIRAGCSKRAMSRHLNGHSNKVNGNRMHGFSFIRIDPNRWITKRIN